MVPTFGKVGNATKVRLGDLKPDTELWIDGSDWLGTVQYGGEELCQYGYNAEGHWYVWAITNPDSYADAGYTEAEGAIADDVMIPINGGLIVYSMLGSPIVFAGQVLVGDSELLTDMNSNVYTGNFMPVDIVLGDLVPDENWIDGSDWLGTIQLGGEELVQFGYNEKGNWYVSYITNPTAFAEVSELSEGDVANNFPIASGSGIIVYSMLGASISIPGAIK